MGLDAVELVIRFEDAFGITISDEVAEQLTTPRQVTEYVLSQVSVTGEASCLAQHAFYFLRGHFAPALNVSRKEFRPDTPLEDLIPVSERRLIWARFKSQIRPNALPDLNRPMWLVTCLLLGTVLTFTGTMVVVWKNFDFGPGFDFSLGLFVAFVVGYGGAFVTRPLKRYFHHGLDCVGDLARYITFHSPNAFKRDKKWTREQVGYVVRGIIVDQIGREDFTEDSRFIKDMHLG